MKVRGDIESVNLATGERWQRVTGDGESRLELVGVSKETMRKLYAKDAEYYRAANEDLNRADGRDIQDVVGLFRALQLQAELTDFMRRNRLRRDEVTLICNKNGRAYLQWKGALPDDFPNMGKL